MPQPHPTTARLLNKLQRIKNKNSGGWTASCPVSGHEHQDKHPSLSIDEKDGRVLVTCFIGHTAEQVVSALGLSLEDLFLKDQQLGPRNILPFREKVPRTAPVAIYTYHDHSGAPVAEKARFESEADGKKSFAWRPKGAQGWPGLESVGLRLTDLALWGLETLRPEEPCYFVEGEKAAQACHEHRLPAVTFSGGSSSRDFGHALEALAGYDLLLWPDNDTPGREYMATVEARLRGIAKSLGIISVPLPPKGDAYEYFANGGNAQDLRDGATPLVGPAVDFLADDALRVRVPTAAGLAIFSFSQIIYTPRNFDCELQVALEAPGFPTEPYQGRIDLLSHSAADGWRRSLEQVYGKEFPWTRLLNTAFSHARAAYTELDRSIDVFDIQDKVGDRFFHNPLLPDSQPTVLFGDGASLKSYVSSMIALASAMGLPFLGAEPRQGATLFLDYEDTEDNFRFRLKRIAAGMGLTDIPQYLIRYFPANGLPLPELIPALQRVIREWGIILLVVDSAAAAVGGEPEKSAPTMAYFRAVSQLHITSLHIAHITKEDVRRGKTQMPFGSIFWSHHARRTWYIQRVQEEDSDDLDIGLFCRKVNDGKKPKPIGVKVHFSGTSGSVVAERQAIAAVPQLQQERDAKWQIWDALTGGAKLTIADLTEELGLHQDAIEKALRSNPKLFTKLNQQAASGGGKGRPAFAWGRRSLQEDTP